MDRNTIIGLVIIAGLLIGYQLYTAPSKAELARQEHVQDSLSNAALEQEAARAQQAAAQTAAKDSIAPLAADTGHVADSLRVVRLADRFGPFTPAAQGSSEVITLANDRLEVGINTFGARPSVIRLKDYTTYTKQPLLLSDPDSGLFEYRFFLGSREISTKDLHFTAEKLGTTGVRLTAPTSEAGKAFVITYQLDSAKWFMDMTAEIVGMPEVDPRNLIFNWAMLGKANEKHLPTERNKCTVYYKYMNEDLQNLSTSKADEKKLEARTNWVAFKQDFFTAAVVSKDGFGSNGSVVSVGVPADEEHTKRYGATLYFEQQPSAHVTLPMKFYLGPNHYNTLRRTEVPQFDRIIDLGWGIFAWMNRFLVIPIFNFLSGFNLSYGIIILVLTVVIKLILLPIAYRNQKSSARMRALKPEIEAINKKFPDQEDMMKRQQANMELYRKAGVSPASGCVPMLLQLPVLWAMFRFFPSSIELRQQPFLWADDLSSYDSILNLPFTIPAYGNHVSLFTLLMAASTIVYSLITSKQMPQQQGMPSMKLMMYLFPVMMLFFMNALPAGLSYYYLLANVISILQMTVMGRWFIDEGKLRAELLANMKKPRKKSRWAQRMEELQKQQQAARRK